MSLTVPPHTAAPIPTVTREYHLPKVDGFHNLTLRRAPVRALKSKEVLVKVHAVSLQYRDLVVAKGQYPLGQKEDPVPCSDMAGEIIAVGDQVTKWSVGDRVCSNFSTEHIFGDPTEEIKLSGLGAPIDGVLTEYKILPAHALVTIPPHLSYVEASTLPCAALTAYNALMGPVPLKGGDTVLVLGTGGVSTFGLQFAAASGADVIVTSSSDSKLEVAAKLGAAHCINYKKTPNWEKEVLRVTHGRGVDHVIEVGGVGTLHKSIQSVRYGGFIHVIGFVAGVGTGDLGNLPALLLGKAVTLRGILIGSRTQFEDMNRLITARQIKPVINSIFEFEEARAAYEYLESQQHIGKVVIKVSKE
ncbi:NAD(P)-binding protein [Laetiporus sulphureus 93-53]|uniref:NAD(P)-binding protein n=1 Tax=Laetiporus sulphureus 93-53 TaxID=1314785 RepID=A0A165B137_9APHY|nr:NAD(P)-binding protein [Laetiporus sulphureus 93-53]KZT00029.1 NAD(P)-binding protein [Laetiporus sulphureus 93-53]